MGFRLTVNVHFTAAHENLWVDYTRHELKHLVRFQPNYKPIYKWKEVLGHGALATGAARKKAIVAVARQLAVDLWRIRTGRLSAQQLGLNL